MLARPSDPYKYYLPKIHIVTYMDDACLLDLAFSRVRSLKNYETFLGGLIQQNSG